MISLKLRLKWLWRDIKSLWYKWRHGIKIGLFEDTLLPSLGRGKFVSVYRRGDIIEIKGEEGYDHEEKVFLIPCQYNHGIMVETWKDGRLQARGHMDLNEFFAFNCTKFSEEWRNKAYYG